MVFVARISEGRIVFDPTMTAVGFRCIGQRADRRPACELAFQRTTGDPTMAHNLAQTDGRAAMAYFGEASWHKLGTKLGNPATAAEATEACANVFHS